MINQPIEEKWKEEFDTRYYDVMKAWKKNGYVLDLSSSLKSFIENLLEQERQRMSEEIYQARKSNTTDSAGDVWEKVLSIINK